MNPILQLECRSGPLTGEERLLLRCGSRLAYERATARSAIRQLTRACMSAMDATALRNLLDTQRTWRSYQKTLG